jgi:hypothetical protein
VVQSLHAGRRGQLERAQLPQFVAIGLNRRRVQFDTRVAKIARCQPRGVLGDRGRIARRASDLRVGKAARETRDARLRLGLRGIELQRHAKIGQRASVVLRIKEAIAAVDKVESDLGVVFNGLSEDAGECIVV